MFYPILLLRLEKRKGKIVLWIQLGQKKNSLEFIKSTYLSWRPDQSMKIEKKYMKLQYFLKYPLLNVKKQKHKIHIKNHIKNLKINKNRTRKKKKKKTVFFFNKSSKKNIFRVKLKRKKYKFLKNKIKFPFLINWNILNKLLFLNKSFFF